ncbi:radical SAM protein [Candidatus Bathyarchaeota archaeon]|nr:radical SAM protein [Candidatus Bathyarchaeota archaeon]
MGKEVIFIAYQNQENLGVGYLSSFLESKGFTSEIIDWNQDPMSIHKKISYEDPILVGFSLIFQYDFSRLYKVSHYLRDRGLKQHFTVGGHYPSLRYGTVLEEARSIDSVVRFEGEITLTELVKTLKEGGDWRSLPGLAYFHRGESVSNELRPLMDDLDNLPFPKRSYADTFSCLGVKFTSLLGSRGCYRNCSFCSIRAFYGAPPGRLRRTRSPENIVNEMEKLYDTGIKIFLFQDDDFFSPGPDGYSWAKELLNELELRNFSDDILWKINCRADEVKEDFFSMLKEVGLYMVYLGIESGSDVGLRLMNKQLRVSDNLRAVKTIKKIGMTYDFGFMLFDPMSSFTTLQENIDFLRTICEDGSCPITFCKMLPYAGTPIEEQLKLEDRLIGGITDPNYKFLSPEMDKYYRFVTETFNEYMSPQGLSSQLRWHINELNVIKKFYGEQEGFMDYLEVFREIVKRSNIASLDTLESSLEIFESGRVTEHQLREIQASLVYEHRNLISALIREMKAFRGKET